MEEKGKDGLSKKAKSPLPLTPLEAVSKEALEGEPEERTERLFTIPKAQSQPVQGVPVSLMTGSRVSDFIYQRKRFRLPSPKEGSWEVT